MRVPAFTSSLGGGVFYFQAHTAEAETLMQLAQSAFGPSRLAVFFEKDVQPYFATKIINRFSSNTDPSGAPWAPLTESTTRIRHSLGYYDDWAINDRTQEMLTVAVTDYEINTSPGFGRLDIPGPQTGLVAEKIRTAQQGKIGPNPMFGGTVTETPPRPFLGADAGDLAAVVKMLQVHVMETVTVSLVGRGLA